jgi:hypothetical protein
MKDNVCGYPAELILRILAQFAIFVIEKAGIHAPEISLARCPKTLVMYRARMRRVKSSSDQSA